MEKYVALQNTAPLMANLAQLILVIHLIYQGETIPEVHSKPFHRISTLKIVDGATDVAGVTEMIGWSNKDPPCAKSSPTLQRFPVALKSYPISGIRAVADLLKSMPEEFSNSALILEGYSMNAVQAIHESETAYPDRLNKLLISPFIVHAANDVGLERLGSKYGNEIRRMIVNASGHHLNAYVNYAVGSETQQELYGHEKWRLKELRKLKQEWDPENRFGWYLPIEV